MGIYHENHQCECTGAIEWGFLLVSLGAYFHRYNLRYNYGIIASISWEMGIVEIVHDFLGPQLDTLVTKPSTDRSIIFPDWLSYIRLYKPEHPYVEGPAYDID